MIHRFISVLLLPHQQAYLRQEAPKGELGLFMILNNIYNCYRVKIRSPD
jgi:NADH:ubiquinone oxidoreductase subunit D